MLSADISNRRKPTWFHQRGGRAEQEEEVQADQKR
jgi:hypothetical protein